MLCAKQKFNTVKCLEVPYNNEKYPLYLITYIDETDKAESGHRNSLSDLLSYRIAFGDKCIIDVICIATNFTVVN